MVKSNAVDAATRDTKTEVYLIRDGGRRGRVPRNAAHLPGALMLHTHTTVRRLR